MSLINTVTYRNDFVVMTGDRKVRVIKADGSKYETDEKHSKGLRLSDRVIFGAGGVLEVAELIKQKLKELVKPSDDLQKCTDKLRIAIEFLYSLDEELRDYLLNKPNGSEEVIMVRLAGFYKDGSSGTVSYTSDGDAQIKEHKELYNFGSFYPNEHDLDTLEACLLLTKEEERNLTLDGVIKRMTSAHKYVSYLSSESVSTDADFYLLKRVVSDDGREHFLYEEGGFDVKEQHEGLPPVDELKFKLGVEAANKRYETALSS